MRTLTGGCHGPQLEFPIICETLAAARHTKFKLMREEVNAYLYENDVEADDLGTDAKHTRTIFKQGVWCLGLKKHTGNDVIERLFQEYIAEHEERRWPGAFLTGEAPPRGYDLAGVIILDKDSKERE